MTCCGMVTIPAISIADMISPDTTEPSQEVLAWQAEQVRRGLKDADEGRFASPEAVEAVIQKYTRNA